jgi:carbon storage regulator
VIDRKKVNDETEVVVMLVLTRKCQQVVVVGASNRLDRLIRVTVMEIRDDKVKLGFEADDDVPIHRLEVWKQIRARGLPDRPTKSLATPAA